MFDLLYWASTAIALMAPAMLLLHRRIEWLYVTIIFFPLANVYVAGLTLFAGLLVVSGFSAVRSIPLSAARWLIIWWSAWGLWTLIGFAVNGFSERQAFQAVEFILYGLIAVQIVVACRIDNRLFYQLVVAAIMSAFLLAAVCLVAAGTSVTWPRNLIGRNEAAFVLIFFGVIPGVLLLMRPTLLAHLPNARPYVYLGLILVVAALAAMQARGALVCALALILGYFTFSISRRLWVSALMFASFSAVLAVVLLSTGLIADLFSVETSFSNLERLNLLQASYRLFEMKPILGWGWGSIDSLIPSAHETVLSYPHPHNFLAHFAVELGIGGCALFAALILRPLVRAAEFLRLGFRSEAIWCLAVAPSLMLLGMIDVVFYGASRAIPLLFVLAFVEALPFRSFVYVQDGVATKHLDLGNSRHARIIGGGVA